MGWSSEWSHFHVSQILRALNVWEKFVVNGSNYAVKVLFSDKVSCSDTRGETSIIIITQPYKPQSIIRIYNYRLFGHPVIQRSHLCICYDVTVLEMESCCPPRNQSWKKVERNRMLWKLFMLRVAQNRLKTSRYGDQMNDISLISRAPCWVACN